MSDSSTEIKGDVQWPPKYRNIKVQKNARTKERQLLSIEHHARPHVNNTGGHKGDCAWMQRNATSRLSTRLLTTTHDNEAQPFPARAGNSSCDVRSRRHQYLALTSPLAFTFYSTGPRASNDIDGHDSRQKTKDDNNTASTVGSILRECAYERRAEKGPR